MDINWRAVAYIAIGYLALSAFNYVFALPIAHASLAAFGLLAFFSGPAGFLFAFVFMPDRWVPTIVSSYVIGTCALAPFLTLSCHRKPRVRNASRVVAVSLWLFAGLFAVSYVFAYAA